MYVYMHMRMYNYSVNINSIIMIVEGIEFHSQTNDPMNLG